MDNQTIKPEQSRSIILAAVAVTLLCYAPAIARMSGSVSYLLPVGAISCAMMLLLLRAWDTYKSLSLPLWNAMVLEVVALLVTFAPTTVHELEGQLENLAGAPMLVADVVVFSAPTIVALAMVALRKRRGKLVTRRFWPYGLVFLALTVAFCINGGRIYLYAVFWALQASVWVCVFWWEKRTGQEALASTPRWQRDVHWAAWNLSLILLAFMFASYSPSNFDWASSIRTYWHPLLAFGLPFLLPAVWRGLSEQREGPFSRAAGLLRPYRVWAYFAFCLAVYAVSLGLAYYCHASYFTGSPMEGVLYVLIALLVYRVEARSEGDDPAPERKGGVLAPVLYVLSCVALSVATNTRVQRIVFGLGGPNLGTSWTSRGDWLRYRYDAFHCGFCEVIDEPILQQYGDGPQLFFMLYDSKGTVLFYGYRVFLFLIPLAVVLLAVLLLRMDSGGGAIGRVGKYLAVSYLARAVLFLLNVVLMTPYYWVIMPFCHFGAIDMILLVLFLRRATARSATARRRPFPVSVNRGGMKAVDAGEAVAGSFTWPLP